MKDYHAFEELLQKNGISYEVSKDLKEFTTLHIGGKADILIEPADQKKIILLISFLKEYEIPYIVLGNGSNMLISDQGYRGAVLVLSSKFCGIEVKGDHIRAQAGADLKDICKAALDASLSGLEFAYGIPGSCGGTTYMNAGAYGGEVGDHIIACTYLDENGILKQADQRELNFSYRHSCFTNRNIIILEVIYRLQHGDQKMMRHIMERNMEKRKEKQPLEFYSAGSTFKRPEGSYASKLIHDCGLKGYAVGDAQVSEKHAGFLINRGNATFQDFLSLIQNVQKKVSRDTGYELMCEVRIIE